MSMQNFRTEQRKPSSLRMSKRLSREIKIRKEGQKSAEGLASVRIDPPLESSAGWEAWMVAVDTASTLACGSEGVPLSCVIRAQEAPDLSGFGQLTWEESAIVGTPLLGLDCHADRMTVHSFIHSQQHWRRLGFPHSCPADARSQRWSTRHHRSPRTLRQ